MAPLVETFLPSPQRQQDHAAIIACHHRARETERSINLIKRMRMIVGATQRCRGIEVAHISINGAIAAWLWHRMIADNFAAPFYREALGNWRAIGGDVKDLAIRREPAPAIRHMLAGDDWCEIRGVELGRHHSTALLLSSLAFWSCFTSGTWEISPASTGCITPPTVGRWRLNCLTWRRRG